MSTCLLWILGVLIVPIFCLWPTAYSCLISAGIAFLNLAADPPREHVLRKRFWIALGFLAYGTFGPYRAIRDELGFPETLLVPAGMAFALLLLAANALHVEALEADLWYSPPLDAEADKAAYEKLVRRLWFPMFAVSSAAFGTALLAGLA